MHAMRIGMLGLAVSGAAVSARAQEADAGADRPPGLLERAGISGSVRAGYWSSTRDLDGEDNLGAGMVWLKAARRLSSRASFLVEGWTAARSPFDDGKASGELREAFVDLRFGRLDYLGGVSVSGVWLPEFRGHRFPLPPPPPGVAFVPDDHDWPGDQWAVRVERTGGAVDWSASYYDGRDLTPDLRPQAGAVRLEHHRVRVAGGDLAANAGRFGLRAEAAYVDTADASGNDPFTKNPYLYLVVGGDRTLREHLNLNVQYLHRVVFDHRRPEGALALLQAVVNSETERVRHGASFRAAYKWFHDTLEAECAAAGFFDPRGMALRPKVTYALSDRWKATVGADLYRGRAASLFGLLRQNSTAFVELRRSF